MYPDKMPRPLCSVTVVCGPPGSGKSTHVTKNAKPGDVVIDLAEIRAELGEDSDLIEALEERNAAIEHLATESIGSARLWFVVTAAKAEQRDYWESKLGGEVVLILASADTCVHRILGDHERPGRFNSVAKQIDAAQRWWEEYEPREGETVIKTD